jgi:hypothetical protein
MKENNALALKESTGKEHNHGQTTQISEPSVYWFPVYEGIFEHAPVLKDAVWLFMWLINRTTWETEGRGAVLGGIPIHDDRPAKELGFPVKTIRRWRRMLIRGDYISIVRTPYGFRYTVLKSKKRQNRQKRDLPKLPISHQESAQIGHRDLPLREQRVPDSGVSKKTTQSRYKDKSVSHDRRNGPTDGISLTAKDLEELGISSLPRRFEPFIELVEENPRGEDEHFVPWAKNILDLCDDGEIEYPKIFYKKLKEAEREAENEQDPYGEIARIKAPTYPPMVSQDEPKPKTVQDYQGSLDTVEKIIQSCAPKGAHKWMLDLKAEYEKKIAEFSESAPKICSEASPQATEPVGVEQAT